jgi:hypothetical protein
VDERLDPRLAGYISGGAGDEHTLRENVAAFRAGGFARACS